MQTLILTLLLFFPGCPIPRPERPPKKVCVRYVSKIEITGKAEKILLNHRYEL